MADDRSNVDVFAALVFGLIAIGFSPILVRIATDTSPLVLVSYRTGISALLLAPFWFWHKRASLFSQKVNWREHGWVALSGFCLGLHFICWLSSLYYTTIASASVLVAVHPIILILVERLWLKRSFARATWLGVALTFAGSVMLGFSDMQTNHAFPHPLLGNALAVAAAIIFAVYLLIGQRVRKQRDWLDYVFPVYGYAAATCILLALSTGGNLTNISSVGFYAGAGLAIGPQILGHGSMNFAVKYVSPTFISTSVLIEPIMASVLAYFLFNELPSPSSLMSLFVILIGILLTWKRAKE